MKERKEYYSCNSCDHLDTINKFIDSKCPECGSSDIQYHAVANEVKYKNGLLEPIATLCRELDKANLKEIQ